MAYTLLADVIVPEVFNNYTTENTPDKSRLIRSGIAAAVSDVVVPDGGDTVNLPFWGDLDGDPQMLQDDTTITTNSLGAGKDVARILYAANSWGANDLAADLAGSDPMVRIADRVMAYWDRAYQKVLLNQLDGMFADNIANDDGDLVLDVSSEDVDTDGLTGKTLDGSNTIDAAQKLGDSSESLTGLMVHSKVYANMKKNNLIEFIPEASNDVGFGLYLGNYSIIVDDSLPTAEGTTSGTKYTSYLFGTGAIAINEGTAKVPTEVDRTAAESKEALFSRKRFLMHPRGVKWVEGSVAGDTPELAELALAANHDRVYDKKNIRVVMAITNG